MLIPIIHHNKNEEFRPLSKAEYVTLIDTFKNDAATVEITRIIAQAGFAIDSGIDSVDLDEIESADHFFQLVDGHEIIILTANYATWNKYKYLFYNHILVKENNNSYTEDFIRTQNEMVFSRNCPGTICRQMYQNNTLAESTTFALVGIQSPASFIRDRMAAGAADLHIHTSASDSSDTPQEVFNRVIAAGLKTFAITDHDNTEAAAAICNCLHGHLQGVDTAEELPVYIPGAEISVQEERELHLLAYFPYGGYERLQYFLQKQQLARDKRNIDMIATLQSLGYDISLDELNSAGDHSVGRMQMALLLKARGYVKTTAQAFAELLGYGQPGYIERPRPSLKEAIVQIRLAGGVPVLAHPALYGWCRSAGSETTKIELLERFSNYKDWGLIGIECFHGEADKNQQHLLSEVALKLQMLRTGGSDDHGRNKTHTKLFDKTSLFY